MNYLDAKAGLADKRSWETKLRQGAFMMGLASTRTSGDCVWNGRSEASVPEWDLIQRQDKFKFFMKNTGAFAGHGGHSHITIVGTRTNSITRFASEERASS